MHLGFCHTLAFPFHNSTSCAKKTAFLKGPPTRRLFPLGALGPRCCAQRLASCSSFLT